MKSLIISAFYIDCTVYLLFVSVATTKNTYGSINNGNSSVRSGKRKLSNPSDKLTMLRQTKC